MAEIIVRVIICYAIGSIPFGLLVARLAGVKDIRSHGSGNIGATNVWRIAGAKVAVWVYLLDIGKGAIAVLIATTSNIESMPIDILAIVCGMIAVLGHVFPIYLRFQGGKGVNTALGVMIVLLPFETVIALLIFLIIVALTKYISLGSILAAITLPLLLITERTFEFNVKSDVLLYFTIGTMLTVLLTHHANISRLLKGTENRFSFSSNKDEDRK